MLNPRLISGVMGDELAIGLLSRAVFHCLDASKSPLSGALDEATGDV
jgi:hypothetical protein